MKLHFLSRAACGLFVFSPEAPAADLQHASAKVEVKAYKEDAFNPGNDGTSLYELNIQEEFTGDIAATGTVRFLQTRTADGASFVGVEYVTGAIGDRKGTFVLQDHGTLKGKTVSGSWVVVPGSGTGELKGLKGQGGFTAELGQHADVTLDYTFEN